MGQAKEHATAALEAARGSSLRAWWNTRQGRVEDVQGVTSETVMPYYEPAMEKLNMAISAADKGDAAGAVVPLEGAVVDMDEGLANYDY
jgi:hypothetical protein